MNCNVVGALSPQHFQEIFNNTFDDIEKQILNIFITHYFICVFISANKKNDFFFSPVLSVMSDNLFVRISCHKWQQPCSAIVVTWSNVKKSKRNKVKVVFCSII